MKDPTDRIRIETNIESAFIAFCVCKYLFLTDNPAVPALQG